MRRWTIALALALTGAAGACAHHVPVPTVRPQLAGQWVPVRGDTAQLEAPRDSAAGRGSDMLPPQRGRDGRRGGYGGGERADEAGARFDAEAFGGTLAAVHRASERFAIAQTDTTVHFSFADGSYFDLTTDGRRREDIWRNIGRIESSARWTPAGLVFERKVEDGGFTVTQTYARAPGADRLVVTTTVKGGPPGERPLTVRRSYQPATS